MTLISDTAQSRTGNLATGGTAALDLSKLDVVYVVRPGETNENLRYSLRSLSNMPHRKVYISGYCPGWVTDNVHVFLTEQRDRPSQENSNYNLFVAASQDQVSEDFIFMNDDFMVMEKTLKLPTMHQGSLDTRIATYKLNNRYHQAYSLIATREELKRLLPDCKLYSYELHIPMIMNKKKLLGMFQHWDKTGRPLFSLRPRTMYGNLYQIEGVETQDAKTSAKSQSQFLSTVRDTPGTDDECWPYIRERFQTPGKYEYGAKL